MIKRCLKARVDVRWVPGIQKQPDPLRTPPKQVEVRPRGDVGEPLRVFLALSDPYGFDAVISVLVGHAGIT